MNIFTFEPSALGALRLIFSYLTIDFICTMVNKYIYKDEDDEKENQKEPSARA